MNRDGEAFAIVLTALFLALTVGVAMCGANT